MEENNRVYVPYEELKKLTTPECRAVHVKNTETEREFEIRLDVNRGTSRKNTGSKRLMHGLTVIPKKTANERHVHLYCEASMYVIKGTMVAYSGIEATRHICPPGTFLYAPEGAIHGVTNPSETEDVLLCWCYSCSSGEDSGTTFVIDDPAVYPPPGWDDPNLIK